MKNLLTVLFMLAFSGFSYAQDSSDQSVGEVSVISASYATKKINQNKPAFSDDDVFVQQPGNTSTSTNRPQTSSRNNSTNNRQINVPVDESADKSKKVEIRTQVQVKNNTQKKIASIEYDFIVVRSGDDQELKRYKFVNKSDIKADKTKNLSDIITGSEANRYFNSKTPGLVFKAEITRVTYQDGSVWIP